MPESPQPSGRIQYQNFPDARGDSDSLDKLKALRLPSLTQKSFFDVGCNEGFFCGYALYDGATSVVGLDASPLFIERAKGHFPTADFLCQSWDVLPAQKFDVILLASSLHYASDQSALIHRLVERLNPNGTLVLELGVSDHHDHQWVEVNRGMDVRLFPTWPLLNEILQPFAWKLVGNSVTQRGDPVPRHVLHITHRKPIVYLLMQASGSGKTSVAKSLFVAAGVPTISGDAVLAQIATGQLATSEEFKTLLGANLDSTKLAETYRQVFRANLHSQFLKLCQIAAGGSSFALDAYVPQERREEVASIMEADGYMVVVLTLSGTNELEPLGHRKLSADRYFSTLQKKTSAVAVNAVNEVKPVAIPRTIGVIDEVSVDPSHITIVGWAVQKNGAAVEALLVQIDGQTVVPQSIGKFSYPAIQRHLMLADDLVGFRVQVPAAATNGTDLARRVRVYAMDAAGTDVQSLWSIPANRSAVKS